MNALIALVALIAGAAIGAAVAWMAARARASVQVAELRAHLEHERRSSQDKLALVERTRQELADQFAALSAEALQRNNSSFLDLARSVFEREQVEARGELTQRAQAVEHLVAPIRETLERVDLQVRELEQSRARAYGELTEQVRNLADGQERLRGETGRLVTALRQPGVRGRWGEMQLRRVVELAGMLAHCDFCEQVTMTSEDGRLRPDLIINLPGDRRVVVDAKVPLQACLDALDAQDEAERAAALGRHVAQVRTHVSALSTKAYWEQVSPTPEFVVLFIPGEVFYSAALEQDSSIIDLGAANGVVIATPTTLIALLKTVAAGWREERIAESAQEVSQLGRDLHKRLKKMADHLNAVGRGLDKTVREYNKAIGSYETRVLVTARKFDELGAGGVDEIPMLAPVETLPRVVLAPQLRLEDGDAESA